MRQWCLLVFAFVLASVVNAQVSVRGELSGLFLTSQGKLVWQTVSSQEDARDLQPLWGHYRLVLTVLSSNKPIKSVEVTAANGQKIWQQNFEPSKFECRIPSYPPSALRVHASDGFKFRVTVSLADGQKFKHEWKAPISKPIHPFRIDWLSLAAATEAMSLMRTYGSRLSPQISKLPIAWCFQGENGRLFINHPNPPKGSRKVSLALLPGVSAFWLPEKQRPFIKPGVIGGMTRVTGEKFTATIHYAPIWANRDPTALQSEVFNATMTVYIALHEALHATLLSALKAQSEQIAPYVLQFIPEDKWVDWLVAQWLEREALKQAIEAAKNAEEVEQTKKMREAVEKGIAQIIPPPTSWSKPKDEWLRLSRQWAWAFLQFRERRRAFFGSNRRWLTRSEQIFEWTENLSLWGALELLDEAEREKMSPLLAADPTAASYPDIDVEDLINESAEVDPNSLSLETVVLLGLGKLLSYWDENWLTKAAKGRMLEDLLAEATGYTDASPEERNEAINEIAQGLIASAAKVRQELKQFFASPKGKPQLTLSGDLPEKLQLYWSEDEEGNGQLQATMLEWDDGSSLRVNRDGKLAFVKPDEIRVFATETEPFWVTRSQDKLVAQIGNDIQFRWLMQSGILSVIVFGEKWLSHKGRTKPIWLPPERWTALQVDKQWLWLKAAIRGGLQFANEGGKRWNEAPMAPITTLQSVTFGKYALTTEAPSDLLFIVRTVNGQPNLRSLKVSLHAPDQNENKFTSQITASKGSKELRLVLPFKLRWSVEQGEDKTQRISWIARFGDKEIRWWLGAVVAEVGLELSEGKSSEIPFLFGVLHPLLQGVKAEALEELPSEGVTPNYAPAIGARCRIYLYRGEFDQKQAQCLAEGVVDETGRAILLIPAFDPQKIGLTASALLEHEVIGCRRLVGLPLWMTYSYVFYGSIISVWSPLAPHEVTFTLEVEGLRQYYRFEKHDGEWQFVKERDEPFKKVRIIVERVELRKEGEFRQTIFDGEVDGHLTLTVPTLGHGLEFKFEEPHSSLRIRIIDPVTGKETHKWLGLSAHALTHYEGESYEIENFRMLVGKNNPPIKVKFVVTTEITAAQNPAKQ
jgi:hypothetical protein